ncbi:5,6-dimethylbenzimidazole synthase [Kribbella deserti]|uniref:5,6-dimethylbenzimidazole synthase n=1 Tax=Kribbella deserti TaxID=1926257 RepID=A0ABV6QKS4_9ACTN
MTLVLGVGLRQGTSYDELRALADTALAGLPRDEVLQVVTVDSKASEPAVARLASELGASVVAAPAGELALQDVPTPSAAVEAHVGSASVAEAAVLLAGASLVVPKQRSAGATVAVGRLPFAAPYPLGEREVVHRVLAERRDIRRGFVDRPIADDVLTRVLASAHRAPSVGLSQPWDFLLIKDVPTRRKIYDLAMAQRDAFAASLPEDRRNAFDGLKIEAILDTPLNIAVTCDPGRGGRHVLGRHADPRTTWFSAAIAVQNLWLATRAEGLGVGWVSFFEPAEVSAVLDLPGHVELVGYLCVGHVEAFPETPELVQSGWASRRPLSWTVHHDSWGQRGLPGAPASSIADDARTAPQVIPVGVQRIEIVVADTPETAALGRAEALVVCVDSVKPDWNFGVLWRPARSVDEAVEHGVELVRDLGLQGVGRIEVSQPAGGLAIAQGLVRGLELGGRACGVAVVSGELGL